MTAITAVAVFHCHPTWSGTMPLLTPSLLNMQSDLVGDGAYAAASFVTEVSPLPSDIVGSFQDPNHNSTPPIPNRNTHRLNIPED